MESYHDLLFFIAFKDYEAKKIIIYSSLKAGYNV